jgi:hypothetical protein
MRYLMMLAAAASLAACHNRSEDEVGAAPERGDTTAVTATDSTRGMPTDSTMGQQPGATDTSMVKATDSTSAGVSTDSSYAPSPSGNAPSDSANQTSDSTSAGAGAWDSTSVSPTDTTKKQ